MLKELKKAVCAANKELPRYGLVTFTWGNVSAIDRAKGLIVIKPSGVEYDELTPDNMTVLDMDGNRVEGDLNPSSDTPTHIELYKTSAAIGGIVHTHSRYATIFAEANRDIPPLGTTHADYFYGAVPCTRAMTPEEITGAYEKETGAVIIETFQKRCIDFDAVPGVVVANHGPFTWGKDALLAVHNAVVLEEVARMAFGVFQLNPAMTGIRQELLDKHYLRKHGKGAYYGQSKA
jgi:L-ribulose-5-phosphate 4-epimerase